MLDKLRSFSKGKLAMVLVAIIIVPFVFWGMGSVFSGGNTNSIAKLNSHNISTKDFVNFINKSKINPEIIKENLENNIIEEFLTQLISIELIELEIENLELRMSDKILANKIKKQTKFHDESNKFSRVKYEKFLLENNLSVADFEMNIKKNELKKKLFIYINGGIKSPYFLINNNYKDQTKKISISYFDLNNVYKKKEDFSYNEITDYISNNEEKFKKEIIDISYVKITPDIISDQNEFNESFFSKIDEIENLILNGKNIIDISKEYSLKINNLYEYSYDDNNEEFINEIYQKRNEDKINLIDKNDFFLLYEVKNNKKILPNIDNEIFIEKVKNDIYENQKYELNKELLKKISTNKFLNDDFKKIVGKNELTEATFISKNDNIKFNLDSMKLLYSLPVNTYTLIVDNNNNVYLAKIINIKVKNLDKFDKDLKKYENGSNNKIKSNLFNSYDFLLNEKYKIKVNQKTIERIKNYFR